MLRLSDHAGERGEAVRLRNGCPVLTLRGKAASAGREQFGVWAGSIALERPAR